METASWCNALPVGMLDMQKKHHRKKHETLFGPVGPGSVGNLQHPPKGYRLGPESRVV